METEELSEDVITARLTAAIRDGALPEIAHYRQLQQGLPLQQLGQCLREAQARVDRWRAPLESARSEQARLEAELQKQEVEFSKYFPNVTTDQHGHSALARIPGDTREEVRRSVSYLRQRAQKLQDGYEAALGQVSHVQRLITQFAASSATPPARGWAAFLYELWESGEVADRLFVRLTDPHAAPDLADSPFVTVSLVS